MNAQTEKPNLQEECLTDFLHKRAMKNNSDYRAKFESNQKLLYKEAPLSRQSSTVLTIPVVFHVMHLGESEGTGTNIPYEQILSALESMNLAYRGNAPYSSSGVDMQIEFCLAAQDPFGNPTNGVNRINASGTSDYSTNGITISDSDNEVAVKALSIWPNSDYYNIWIVSEINGNDAGGGTQGYAYFPGARSSYDGTVIMYNSIGYDADGSRCFDVKNYTNLNTTLIHELGHGLGLYHTFEGDEDGTTCPSNTDCYIDGDQCCDTPPHDRTSGCPTSGNNACGTAWSGHQNNFMDYSSASCQTEFTPDQKTRARISLSVGRASLLTSSACTPVSSPSADFITECSSKKGCKGSSIKFHDLSTHNPTSWSWTFSGGTPATSTEQNPSITYNTAGTYSVSLVSSNSFGDGTIETKTSYITIYDSPTAACTPSIANSGYYGYALSNVTFNNINYSSSLTINGYLDNSCSSSTCVTEGESYSLSVSADNQGSQEGLYAVYIDYNDNGTLNDADETVFTGSTVSDLGIQTATTSVTIPKNATESNLLRMRVINDQLYLDGPCSNLWTGEAEDYGVYISPEVSISSQPSNANLCSGENANFSVASTGVEKFQWQENKGSGFLNISNSSIYSGTTTGTLTITGVNAGMDGYNYRCVLNNGCDQTINSSSANLNLNKVTDISTSLNGITIEANNTNASYVWLECDNDFSVVTGEISQSYTPLLHGNYAVKLTENSCIDTSACVYVNTVGIIENSFQDKFIIYPNPTNGIFAIEFNSPQEFIKLKIMDASGKLVSENIHKTTSLIEHELDRPKGVYLIEVSDLKSQRSLIRLIKR